MYLAYILCKITNKSPNIVTEKNRVRPKKGEVFRLKANNIKAKKILNWKPMYSGKSTELIRRLSIFAEMGFKVLYANSKIDNRSYCYLCSNTQPHEGTQGMASAMLGVLRYNACDVSQYYFGTSL